MSLNKLNPVNWFVTESVGIDWQTGGWGFWKCLYDNFPTSCPSLVRILLGMRSCQYKLWMLGNGFSALFSAVLWETKRLGVCRQDRFLLRSFPWIGMKLIKSTKNLHFCNFSSQLISIRIQSDKYAQYFLIQPYIYFEDEEVNEDGIHGLYLHAQYTLRRK